MAPEYPWELASLLTAPCGSPGGGCQGELWADPPSWQLSTVLLGMVMMYTLDRRIPFPINNHHIPISLSPGH
ncbi:hypothetical protein Pelo_9837 [Pelomyxa schiedti]|nr:hypothetical protein Pelo_9837 [Pelomyxa schiedti]